MITNRSGSAKEIPLRPMSLEARRVGESGVLKDGLCQRIRVCLIQASWRDALIAEEGSEELHESS